MLGLVPFLAISLPTIVGSLPTTLTPSSPHVPHTVISIPSSEPTDPILANSYFGSYGSDEFSHNIYILPSHELSSLTDDHSQRASTFRKGDGERVVWIGRAGLEEDFGRGLMDIKHVNESAYEMEAFVRDGRFDSVESSFNGRGNQVVFNQMGLGEEKTMRVIGGFRDHALVAVGRTVLPYLDMLLPRGLVSVVLPEESLPLLGNQVDKERVEFLANITKHVEYNPKIHKLVNSLSLDDFQEVVRYLSGENPESPIHSRHSFSSGAKLAAQWIADEIEKTGAKCNLHDFLVGFSPNVICDYPVLKGKKEKTGQIILSGHYDSRGSFGSTRMPGADDDASGTAQVLGIARAIKRAGIKGFEEKVTLALFAGEEQGLLGSQAFAKELYNQKATILLQVQADMLAYHDPEESLQLGFPDSIGLPEAAELLGKISGIYSPELVVGVTKACCSDHQSFVQYGFAATQVFERNGGIIDPMYHNSGDLSNRIGYDFNQLKAIAKVTFATLLEIAGGHAV